MARFPDSRIVAARLSSQFAMAYKPSPYVLENGLQTVPNQ